jgi:glycosyltransferase involved in cell wall biosynthesis
LNVICVIRSDVSGQRLIQIYNGVDDQRFAPQIPPAVTPWNDTEHFVFGTVGRVQAVKDQVTLLRAFALLLQRDPQARARLRLMIVGDGPLLPQLQQEADTLGISDLLWLTGSRDDIPALMRAMHVFVLPSLSEGISNTILEAMAAACLSLPAVGGNPELIEPGQTGMLVPAADVLQLADVMASYLQQPAMAGRQGQIARQTIESRFSMQRMVDQYVAVYRKAL